jgi:hypothetical protein
MRAVHLSCFFDGALRPRPLCGAKGKDSAMLSEVTCQECRRRYLIEFDDGTTGYFARYHT